MPPAPNGRSRGAWRRAARCAKEGAEEEPACRRSRAPPAQLGKPRARAGQRNTLPGVAAGRSAWQGKVAVAAGFVSISHCVSVPVSVCVSLFLLLSFSLPRLRQHRHGKKP